jgi:hypothetical protein
MAATGNNRNAADQLLFKMQRDGELVRKAASTRCRIRLVRKKKGGRLMKSR